MGDFDKKLDEMMARAEGRWAEEPEEVQEDKESEENETPEELKHAIMSPFMADAPLVMIKSDGVYYIGALLRADDASCMLGISMIMEERIVPDPVDKTKPKLQVIIRTPWMALEIPNELFFVHSMMYLLDNRKLSNIQMAEQYEHDVKEVLAASAGISVPTNEDIAKVSQ